MRPIREMMEQTYDRGLENLIAGETGISKIDGDNGKLWYRGYTIEDLAEHGSFDEVSYLLIHGELPTASQYERWRKDMENWHEPPEEAMAVIKTLPDDTHALMLYRTMLSVAACHIPQGENTRLDAQWRRPAGILGWCSTLAAATICHILGKEFNPFNPGQSFSANFLTQALGREPTEYEIKAFDVCMIVQAEHGLQASALAALTVISTGADLGSAVLAGMGAVSGNLHGGAIKKAFLNLLELKSVDEAKAWVNVKLNEGYRFPGFGHPIYKTHDPRTKILEPYAKKLLENKGEELLWDIYQTVRDGIESKLGEKEIFITVYGVTGLIYHALEIPVGSFPIIFALANQTGWMAHCLEYLSEGKMIEPGAIYTG
ncbi:MAG: citrate/2-methylcitrate synthase [Candidatus Electryonea clarkiae]|nr:citrate/2-methylcitrate synthase [Candidatus Electryonea clarkiae]MDP8288489.1 citrate/2-methylcitrate synthase [Candidatus Electryonea clarkiae]